jgi:hypothetical protein
LILGENLRCHIFFRVGFGTPGLLRNLYINLTVKILIVVRFHVNWPWLFFVDVAFTIGCSLRMSCMKKAVVLGGIDVGFKGREWLSDTS